LILFITLAQASAQKDQITTERSYKARFLCPDFNMAGAVQADGQDRC